MKRRDFLGAMALLPLIGHGAAAQPPTITRLAYGSCAIHDQPQPIWDVIGEARPDLFAFIGDNIYGDTTDMKVLREKYAMLAAIPEFGRFRRQVPIVATWDDHDFGVNDGGREYPMKAESKAIMLDFFGEPRDSVRRQRAGVYTSYLFGQHPRRVQLILLDLRWFRSPLAGDIDKAYLPNPDPTATLMGPEQWTWLEEQLSVAADFRILASSIQLISAEHRWEKWANFPRDRARLLQTLDRLAVRNLVVISGDMHFAELSMDKTPQGHPLYELTASGINRFEDGRHFPNAHRLAIFDTDVHFGLITIDWNASRATLQIRDGGGKKRIEHFFELPSPPS